MPNSRYQTILRFRWLFMLILACIATALLVGVALHPHSASIQSPTKLWSIDLGADRDFRKRLSVEEVSLSPPSVNFLNGSQIICDFYGGPIQGTGESSMSSGYHVLEIDAHTGKLGRKLDFRALEDNYRALPVADGGFMVLADDVLKVFSNQFVPKLSYPTPRVEGGKYFDRWLVDIAPGGQTALLYNHQPGREQGKWTWLRTAKLTAIRSVEGPLTRSIRASDTSGIFDGVDDRELLSTLKATVLCTRCRAFFLTDDLLFLDKGDTYSIRTIEGETRGEGNLGIGGANFNRAAQASRFVYSTGHYNGSGYPIQTHFDSITAKIRVWDWVTNKLIAEISVDEPAGNPSAGLSQMSLALSPDGENLAVLIHHTLSLYRLPYD